MLPIVEDEIDSFEDDVQMFEALGSDTSSQEQAESLDTRVDAVDDEIEEIVKVCTVGHIVCCKFPSLH